jgi:hypothetical protein
VQFRRGADSPCRWPYEPYEPSPRNPRATPGADPAPPASSLVAPRAAPRAMSIASATALRSPGYKCAYVRKNTAGSCPSAAAAAVTGHTALRHEARPQCAARHRASPTRGTRAGWPPAATPDDANSRPFRNRSSSWRSGEAPFDGGLRRLPA